VRANGRTRRRGRERAPAPHEHEASRAATVSDPTCPVEVPGTSVTVEDTDKGAALVFVTTGDVAQVRERAKQLAAAIASRSSSSTLASMISTPASADESEIDRGARVTLAASRADDVAALQSELRMHASHLANGTCKMAM
jgi:hypothetical protein